MRWTVMLRDNLFSFPEERGLMHYLRLLGIGLGVLFLAVTPAVAGTIYSETLTTNTTQDGANGVTFTVTFNATTATTFTMTMQVESTSAASLDDFSINLLGGGSSPSINVTAFTPPASSTGWTFGDNSKNDNGQGKFGCTSQTGFGGWLCATGLKTDGPLMLNANTPYTFSFSGTYSGTVTTPFDLMANGFVGTTHFGVSRNMTPTTPVTPEPSSLVLLGSGLIGMGTFARRKLRR